jgi:chemotaxis protein CheD
MSIKQNIYVSIGKAEWSKAPDVLICKGLGSCVAVCLYDEVKKIGCIIHILLPSGENADKPYLFANSGIEAALKESVKRGMNRERVWAKIVGGACVFSGVNNTVGMRNVEEVKRWLNVFKIPIISEDVGGNYGRNVTFYLENGKVEVFSFKKGVIVL